ncbi:phosphopantetheine-binding protein [Streptomyces sp. NPDC096205]|uniref:phosphopantetheine-binding protein n=1 Tax=Streptomyces sp. NPDC096205 TaxID=3366081 RepID=UPI0038218731
MLTPADVHSTVVQQLQRLLEESSGDQISPQPGDELIALGLNSLLLARLIIVLEEETGTDPFAEGASLADIRSVGDLVATYEKALSRRVEV